MKFTTLKLLPLLLIVAAVFRFPCDDLRGSYVLLFGMGVSIGLAAYLFRVNPWWGMYLGASSLSLIFPHYTQFSYITHHAIFFGFVWVLLSYKSDPDDLMDAMCIIALCNIAFLLLQSVYIDPLYHTDKPVGLMSNRNETSALLGISLAAFFRGRWKYFIPVVLLGIHLTTSMNGWACVGAMGAAYVVVKYRWYVSISILFLGLLTALFLAQNTDLLNGRGEIWSAGITYLKSHWITGIGLGHWKVAFSKPVFFKDVSDGLRASTAHNEFLQMFVEMGILFPLILSGYIVHIVRKSKDIVSTMAIYAIAASCFFHFLFHIGTTAFIAVTWMGIWQRRNETFQASV